MLLNAKKFSAGKYQKFYSHNFWETSVSVIKENSLHAINILAGEKFTLVHLDGETMQRTPELLRCLAKIVKHEHVLIIRNTLGEEVNTSLSALEKSVLNNEKTYY